MNDTETTKPESAVGLQRGNNTQKLPGGITGKGFRPGQSGNPAGRRKGQVSLKAAAQRVTTRPDCERIVRRLVALASQGRIDAAKLLAELLDDAKAPAALAVAVSEPGLCKACELRQQKLDNFDWDAFGELCKQVRLVPPNEGGGEPPQSASATA